MTQTFKLVFMSLCALALSGCIVPKSRLDEAMAKCALMESDLRSKDQNLDDNNKVIASLEATNKALKADTEKTRQLCSEEQTKAKAAQEQMDAELLKVKGRIVEKENELLAVKTEVVAKNKEMLTVKDEMTRQLREKDKKSEDLIYSIREIQARTESLLDRIKTIQ